MTWRVMPPNCTRPMRMPACSLTSRVLPGMARHMSVSSEHTYTPGASHIVTPVTHACELSSGVLFRVVKNDAQSVPAARSQGAHPMLQRCSVIPAGTLHGAIAGWEQD